MCSAMQNFRWPLEVLSSAEARADASLSTRMDNVDLPLLGNTNDLVHYVSECTCNANE